MTISANSSKILRTLSAFAVNLAAAWFFTLAAPGELSELTTRFLYSMMNLYIAINLELISKS